MSFALNNKHYLTLLKFFIIFQPILDIATSLTIHFFNTSITIGIIVRVIFMGITLSYIFFGNSSPYKYYLITYVTTTFIILSVGFIGNILLKPSFNFFLEIQWITKVIYLIIMFAGLVIVFTSTKHYQKQKLFILKLIYIAMSITGLSILMAIITNTSTSTYKWVLSGYKGWFFSGNELGAIIAITFPLVILYSIKKTKSYKDFLFWIPTLALATLGLLLGTKVGLFAIIGTLVITLFTLLMQWIYQRRIRHIKSKYNGALLNTIIVIILFILIAPFSPGIKNLTVDMPIPEKENIIAGLNESKNDSLEEILEDESAINEYDLPTFLDSNLVNKLLSSRHFYFTRQYHQYMEANLFQKAFGMGYAGNYTITRKTIEMDFLDVFFSFGILGSILLSLPLIALFIFIIGKALGTLKFFINIENVLLLTSVFLGIGVSIIAGHVWFAPAVNLYFVIPIALLLVNLNKKEAH